MGMATLPTQMVGMPCWDRSTSIFSPAAGNTTTETAYLNADGSGKTGTLANAKRCVAGEHWNLQMLTVVLPADSTAGIKFVITVNKDSDNSVIETYTFWFFSKGTYFLPIGAASPNGAAAVVSYVKLVVTNSDVNPMHYRLSGIINTQN